MNEDLGVALLLALCAIPAVAAPSKHHTRDDIWSNAWSHVRSESRYMRVVLAEGVQYSPTFAELMDRIDDSNVIVHVECTRLNGRALQGRTLFVVAKRDVRYVRVEVSCPLMRRELIVIVGHELQHVAEIAAAPDVVDERSFAGLLQKIGFSRGTQYETNAAIDTGDRVSDEMLVHRAVSSAIAASH